MTEPRPRSAATAGPALEISGLHVSYGSARVLRGIDLRLDDGVVTLLGRNGMGKTTLCNTIMGLLRPAAGSIRIFGREAVGREPNEIVNMGVGYVPQGRRVWPALTVDEHLRMLARRHDHGWTPERVYETFPRLAERRASGGQQLSGGEQQMLAIGRALLANPRLLILDEPTEGLAPTIVRQIEQLLRSLAADGEMAILLVEQNLKVALDVAERAVVIVNGEIALETEAASLRQDRERQRQLLGVSKDSAEDLTAAPAAVPAPAATAEARPMSDDDERPTVPAFTRWGHGNPLAGNRAPAAGPPAAQWQPTRWSQAASPAGGETARTPTAPAPPQAASAPARAAARGPEPGAGPARPTSVPFRRDPLRAAYVAGTFDTKGRELEYLARCLADAGVAVRTVDLSTSDRPSFADVRPTTVADDHPEGRRAVFTGDRGSAVAAMAEAFARFATRQRDLGGLLSAGGSGATALATPAMQALPVGVPKLMVSTVASGDVAPYVGPTDICMMYSVTDVSGLNRISRQVLGNAAHAMAGMVGMPLPAAADDRPAVGMTMFGVTTPCVQAVQRALEDDHDCLVFHATGTGGQSMEKLAGSGLLDGLLDISLTEVCDLHVGGVMSAGESRLDILAERDIPYVGSVGALDMVNWHAIDTVPAQFGQRNLYRHNPQVTLMRTTPEECREMGRWIGRKLSRARGPVHFLLPEGGVSMLDAPGQPFHDPEADAALFAAIEETFETSERRRLERLPHHINDPQFADALVAAYRRIERSGDARRETVQP